MEVSAANLQASILYCTLTLILSSLRSNTHATVLFSRKIFHCDPLRKSFIFLVEMFIVLHVTMLTSFKEGSVRVLSALVRLQAPTFLGEEGTKIEMYVTF